MRSKQHISTSTPLLCLLLSAACSARSRKCREPNLRFRKGRTFCIALLTALQKCDWQVFRRLLNKNLHRCLPCAPCISYLKVSASSGKAQQPRMSSHDAKRQKSKAGSKTAKGLSLERFAAAKSSAYNKREKKEKQFAMNANKVNKYRKLKRKLQQRGFLPQVDCYCQNLLRHICHP